MKIEVMQKIVKLYENKRILWDSRHPEYYNKHKREDVWREMSLTMNVPVVELKKKITSLLGSYRREKSREKKSLVTGSGLDVYKSKWFAFKWFSFLSVKNIQNDTVDTMDNVDKQEGFEETRKETTKEEPFFAESPPTTSHQDEPPVTQSISASQFVQAKKRKRVNDDTTNSVQSEILLEAFSILKKASATPADHYETFGMYVASELRKYDGQTLPHVKRAISDVLFRADLGEFSHTRTIAEYCNPTFSAASFSSSSHPSPPPSSSSYIKLRDDLGAPQAQQGESLDYLNSVNPERIQ